MRENIRAAAVHTLIFTDLDGTLLDDRYDLVGAASALDAVVRMGAIAIPVTSKTRRECEALNALRRFKTPLIFENGSGICWHGMGGEQSGNDVEIKGPGYKALCERLRKVRVNGQFHFRGFNEMCPEELSSRTGLSPQMARLALAREATEPLVWEDTQSSLRAFTEYVSMFHLDLLEGGRFLHVMPQTDKGAAAARVAARWEACSGRRVETLGCGDSPNDLALLTYTDSCILFPRPDGSYLDIPERTCCKAPVAGHETWLAAVEQYLRKKAGRPIEQQL